ncbi:MAG TPA: 30S ribosomal protein S1, partial [candidate division Zixibacteria bacterium]|nr:30S ribosomal protein S1 [candidate division Zixibacteria bacterium]
MAKKKKTVPEDIEEQFATEGEEQEAQQAKEFRALLDESYQHRKFEEGEIVRGTVARITFDAVIVDIGFKSEGVVPTSEFTGLDQVKIGDVLDLLLEQVENEDGQMVLSKSKADFIRVWDKVKASVDGETQVEGKVVKRIKGGLIVDLMGVDAFLPGSQIGLRPLETVDSLIGQAVPLKVIKINKKKRNIIVSR